MASGSDSWVQMGQSMQAPLGGLVQVGQGGRGGRGSGGHEVGVRDRIQYVRFSRTEVSGNRTCWPVRVRVRRSLRVRVRVRVTAPAGSACLPEVVSDDEGLEFMWCPLFVPVDLGLG